jgi:hypothetical protein
MSNRNWFREIHRYFYGNAELFYRQTGVARNNRTGTVIHAFPHQVSPDDSVLWLILPMIHCRGRPDLCAMVLRPDLVIHDHGDRML